MDKKKILSLALWVLPLIVVAIGLSPSSVQIISGENVYTTNFTVTIKDADFGWCPPVVLLMNYIVFGMVALHGITKKAFWFTGVFGLSFVAACIAVLPILARSEPLILPNVLVAILLCAETLIAKLVGSKKTQEKDTGKGKTLRKY